MNFFINKNQLYYNSLKVRPGHITTLINNIEYINDLNLLSNFLSSKKGEIDKIINNKSDLSSIQTKIIETIPSNKNLNLSDLLQSKDNNNVKDLPLSEDSIVLKNQPAKIFSLGNKYISLNIFKNIIKQFNKKNDQIKKHRKSFNKTNLRHYLNLMTKFKYNISNSHYNLYKFYNSNKYLFIMKKVTNYLNIFFNSKGCFISKPSFNLIYTNNSIEKEINSTLNIKNNRPRIIINLFYYIKTKELDYNNSKKKNNAKILTETFETKFSNLSDYLTKLFKTEIELNITRLYKPYQDSDILVQFLNSESFNYKFIKLTKKLFKKISLNRKNKMNFISESDFISTTTNNHFSYPSNISGINIKLAGRSLNERIIPRLTVKRAQRGSFNRLNAKLIQKSIFTDKTKKGSFSFTVTLSQNF